MLRRIKCTQLETWTSAEGMPGWRSWTSLDGLPWLITSQDGLGGPNRWEQDPRRVRESFVMPRETSWEVFCQLEDVARQETGLEREALDVIVAGMEPGDDGEDGLRSFRLLGGEG